MNFGRNIFIAISIASFAFSLIALYKIFYSSNIVSNKFYFYCLILSLITSIFFIYGLKLKKSFQDNLSLVIVSTIFTVYSIETFFHIKNINSIILNSNKSINDIRKSKAEEMNIFYDDRSKVSIIENLKQNGVVAAPKFYPIQL